MTGLGMRKFTEDFKREAVRLVQTSGRTIERSTLGKWLAKQREADLLSGPHENTAKELTRLRKENEILRAERDLLKKAAAFFAQETSR